MKKNFLGIIIFICALFIPTIAHADSTAERIHFISSTNGDSMIIESNGHYGLVDALDSTEVSKVINYATALGVQKFDFVIMTHNHEDHIGGISALADFFDSNTIVFYKEDLLVSDDYEEYTLGLHNHTNYETAIQTFTTNGSKKCDVTKAYLESNAACNLTILTNSGISEVTYDANPADANADADYPYSTQYATKTRENLSFAFGDYNINLYSLYSVSYHHENLNSIVTLVTYTFEDEDEEEQSYTALLTGDVETARGDFDYSTTSSSSNIITDPTGTCIWCRELGLENQIADIIESVNLLKAANHGSNVSNSLYSIFRYEPQYYVITGGETNGEPYDNNVIPMTYLKANGAKSYLASEAPGALVAVFDETNGITIKNYNTSATETATEYSDPSDGPFTNGWKQLYVENVEALTLAYVENGSVITDQWKDIIRNSAEHRYHFDETGLIDTGFFVEILDVNALANEELTIEEILGTLNYGTGYKTYYLCEDNACLGEMQTGFQTIDGYKYYFRTVADEISEGNKGEMVVGLAEINGDKYYFRTKTDEVFTGPQGSALINGCVTVDVSGTDTLMCFDSNGIYTTNAVPTPAPTTDLCTNPTYNGEAQTITSAPLGGYTLSNNEQTNAGTYTVTATKNPGYVWDDNDTSETKTIQCSIEKAQLTKPTMTEVSYIYTGEEIIPTFEDYNDWGIIETIKDANNNPVTTPTNVGTYYTTLTLTSPGNNMEWIEEIEDDTAPDGIRIETSTDPITYEWAIVTAQRPAPAASNTSFQYDGTEHSIAVSTGEGELEYSLTGVATDWSTTKPGRTEVGATQIFVRVKADLNYSASDVVSATVTITKRELTRPTIIGGSYEYTGLSITPVIQGFDSAIMTVTGNTSATNVGAYSVTVNIKDDATTRSRYIWADQSYSASIIPWSITKTQKLTPSVTSYNEKPYDGNPHTVTINSADPVEYSLDGLNWSDTAPTRTNVGTTLLHVRAKGNNNYEPSTAVNAVINIVPAKLNKPVLVTSSFDYTGSLITPEIYGYDSTIMNISGDTSGTDVNQYTITIGLKPIPSTSPAEYNYAWIEDDTTDDVNLVWEIIQNAYPAPTVAGYNGTYDGNEHTITVTGSGTMKYSTDNTNWVDVLPTRTDAGTTTVYVKRIGDENHSASNVVSAKIIIAKANIESPTVTSYSGNYDGSSHTITVSPVSIGTLKYSTDQVNWSTTKPTRTSVGTTTVYVKVFGDSNYNNSSTVTGTITINEDATYEIKNYTVDETNKYITKIIVGTDLETFKSNIILGSEYSVVVDTKTVNGKKLLYTGGKTKIMHGTTVVKEYTNIVIGDTNGDGLTNSADLLRIRQHLLGTKLLTGVYFIASDINYDNIINSADLLRVRQHLLGTKLIG